jgi:6-phosphofructokinase 1
MKTGFKALIAHGGGPTAVLNASLAGVVAECRGRASTLYGARFGLTGERLDLLQFSVDKMAAIAATPGSAIGSTRSRLSPDDIDRLLDVLRREDIQVIFYTGGNGSMQTALELSRHCQVIGIPKTIDNDLFVTHHTPGYASTGYFFACAARDVGADNRALPSPICVLETLGRNSGWIVAATALARGTSDDAPHLIYFPERPLSLDRIAADVETAYRRLGRVVIAVCEGQLDEKGVAFGADVDRAESAVHRLASNLGHTLARLLSEKLGLRARAEKPGLLGRSCGPYARERDRREAFECGRVAVRAAAEGHTGIMIALDANGGTFTTPLESVARRERTLPLDWVSPAGNDVASAFIDYAAPLIGAVPGYAQLDSV